MPRAYPKHVCTVLHLPSLLDCGGWRERGEIKPAIRPALYIVFLVVVGIVEECGRDANLLNQFGNKIALVEPSVLLNFAVIPPCRRARIVADNPLANALAFLETKIAIAFPRV